ncbi:hypothetical protein C8Q76DRAFT_698094 [Earliella scabrosa]|nr:hypothetical protein C8Q76DRAFT_698094 [Earliella scabrosa]
MSTTPPAPPSPTFPSPTNPQQIHAAARLELELIAWRISQAIMHYPDRPSALCSARFAHGIARELWGAISAMGIASSVEEILPNQQDHSGLPALIKAVLQEAQWEGMRINVSMERLSFDALEPLLFTMRDFSDSHLVGGKWWTWPEVSNAEMPYWWNAPNELVPRPMENHLSEIGGMDGHVYVIREAARAHINRPLGES